MKKSFEFRGETTTYLEEKVGQNQWIHINGRTLCIPLGQTAQTRRKGSASGQKNEVVAPMPGKVTKVIVKEGQAVKKGDSVIVMEAMKMEYTLKAETSGLVKKLSAEVGSQVSLGQVMVQFEEEKP